MCFDHLALVAAAERIGVDEALGQADHADLEAARELDLGCRAKRDLDAAAADVDDDGRLRRIDAVDGGDVDQPRFLGAGDDAGRMPVLRSMARRNSPPFSASRVALVAAARISST